MSTCPTCAKPIVHIDAEIDPRALDLRLVAACGHEVPQDIGRDLWRRGMRWTVPVISGATLGAAERHRQLHEEGYTPEHDAALDPGDLTWAAWCLLDAAASPTPVTDPPKMWPLAPEKWKPDQSPMRRLVIAEALIAAEIDRRLMESRMQK